MPNCSGCEWSNDNTPQCKKNNDLTNIPEECDVDCFLPYPVDYFNTPDTDLFFNGNEFRINEQGFSGLQAIDPAIIAAQEFISFHSDDSSIRYVTDIKNQFMCGDDTLTSGEDTKNYPDLPDREKMYSLLSLDKRSAYYRGPIKWAKIADTQLFRDIIGEITPVDFESTFNGLIDNDGVHLEWYNIRTSQLLTNDQVEAEIESTPESVTIPDYDSTTGQFLITFGGIIDLLATEETEETEETIATALGRISNIIRILNPDTNTTDLNPNIVMELPLYLPESTEIRRTREEQLEVLENDRASGSTGLQGGQYVPINIEHFIDIFMITKDDVEKRTLEKNLNTLLNTNEDDTAMLLSINNHYSIRDLGSNFEHLKYIERKIKKFLGTDTEDFVTVFESHVNYDKLCSEGFSTRPMEILGNLLKLNVDGSVNEQGFQEEKRVFKMLLKYVPSLIKKVLEISEELEMFKCDRVTKKTRLYREIYRDLFINSNVLKFELPDLGVTEFFSDFNKNIYTKIILLIFIGFIISRIISLFSFNVGVKV